MLFTSYTSNRDQDNAYVCCHWHTHVVLPKPVLLAVLEVLGLGLLPGPQTLEAWAVCVGLGRSHAIKAIAGSSLWVKVANTACGLTNTTCASVEV